MADQKVSDLPSLNGSAVDPADLLYIVDSSAGTAGSKKITIGQFQLAPYSGGTVNGVAYFDGTKVVASGSDLVFDGTNLGVGTAAPGARVHTVKTSAGAATVGAFLQNSDNTLGTEVRLAFAANTALLSSDRYGWIGYVNTGGTNGGALTFATTPGGTPATEQMRLTNGGELLVGATSNANNYKYHVVQNGNDPAIGVFANSATTPYGINVYYGGAAPNNSNANTSFLYCNDISAVRIQLSSNGGIANYQANDTNLSDRREKTNFAPSKSYLDAICAIPVQTFNYIDQNLEEDPGLTLGVVAQDVQAVAPELVRESNWGTEDDPKVRLSIYQTDMQYALMKCIQELKAELDATKARLAALEAK